MQICKFHIDEVTPSSRVATLTQQTLISDVVIIVTYFPADAALHSVLSHELLLKLGHKLLFDRLHLMSRRPRVFVRLRADVISGQAWCFSV